MTLTPPHQATSVPAPTPSLRTVQRRIHIFTNDPATELTQMATRLSRLNELGIRLEGSEVLDDIAVDMGERAGFLYAMVNAFGEEQTFLGLRNPPRDAGYPLVGRTMSRAHGYCPEVVQRRRGLPLPNVAASPRFQGNHVVDAIGIQSYFGAPIIDKATGIVLATVCIVDPEPRTLADAARLQAIVKDGTRAAAAELKIEMPVP
ncbi:GAF domain-containing protein [Streptomyces sp. NPDC002755]